MNRTPPAWRCSALAVATATLLSACGGGDGTSDGAVDNPTAGDAAAHDDANPATLARIDEIMASVDAATRERGLATSGDTPRPPGAPTPQGSAEPDRSPGPFPDHFPDRLPGLFPGVVQTNLVANKPQYHAQLVEPALRNPWGIAIRPAGLGGHFWLGAERTGQSIQYVGDVGKQPLFQDALKVVATGGPVTGVSFNPGSRFVITQSHPNGAITNASKFFFANASGTVTAWTERARPDGGVDHPADSVTVVDRTAQHSSFLGVTVSPKADRLYVADFGAEAALRVYDGNFTEKAPLPNPFESAGPRPDGFAAFNVQTLGQRTFATYGRHVVPGPGVEPPREGRLAEFDRHGKLVARWRGRGYLNYPWGVAFAPKDFGLYAGCLLVGNFGDGTVVAFHPRLKVALDYVRDDHGRRVVLDGLWGLQFGNGASLGEADHLYFAAGPNKEEDGLFGKLQANPRTLPYLGGLSMCQ